MAAFDGDVYDPNTFDTPPTTVTDTGSQYRFVDDTRRIWGLIRNAKVERLSKEYRSWWRKG